MIDVSLVMKPLWENALGKGLGKRYDRDKIRKLYERL
jgi:3-deoxy-alpha-D-manno-octulosonate 8-oxidase